MSSESKPATPRANDQQSRRPFRAVDVLSGSIDRRAKPKTERVRKQISAQLEPNQLRLLGELHARLNATASKRIEKSDLVGLGIELLAAALESAGREHAPAPDSKGSAVLNGRTAEGGNDSEFRDVDAIRTYVRTYVRASKRER